MHGGFSKPKREPVTYSPIFWLLAQLCYALAWLLDADIARAYKAEHEQQNKRKKRHY